MDRFDGLTREDKLGDAYQDILSFEKQLCDDGTVIMKFFLYIDKDEQKKRFKKLEGSKETSWRVTEEDWNRNKDFDRYLKMNEEMLEKTDTDYAPWVIIEAVDKDYAALKIVSTVMDRLEYELEHRRPEDGKQAQRQESKTRERFKNGVLSGIDLSKSLTEEEYKTRLKKLQKRLAELHSELYRLRIPVVIGFEGWDAGGKGGAIKRLTSNLDPRGYRVNPTAAPNDIEKVHHYLWRFWNSVPKAGHIAIFDRTWYGRVMVERIEGFCSEAEWRRAYQEINEMESHMANAGAVVLKFWLHIDKDEQERRFKERQANPAKQWKITDEDWRNREKWDQYEEAVNEMLIRTSTTYAPWIVVEGNDKRYARVKVLQTVVDALEKKVKGSKDRQMSETNHVIVIGAGAAGMLAAIAAARKALPWSCGSRTKSRAKAVYHRQRPVQCDQCLRYGGTAGLRGEQFQIPVQQFLRFYKPGHDGFAGTGRASPEGGAGKPGISPV